MTKPASEPGMDAAIRPGLRWLDDRGRHIQAHGGAVTKVGDLCYWFGEDRSPENGPDRYARACVGVATILPEFDSAKSPPPVQAKTTPTRTR